jgi:hypothetical protein
MVSASVVKTGTPAFARMMTIRHDEHRTVSRSRRLTHFQKATDAGLGCTVLLSKELEVGCG